MAKKYRKNGKLARFSIFSVFFGRFFFPIFDRGKISTFFPFFSPIRPVFHCVAGVHDCNFGDSCGESLEGSQAARASGKSLDFPGSSPDFPGSSPAVPRKFSHYPEVPRKFPHFPEVPRKFLSDFPRSSLTVELNSNPEVPRKFPRSSPATSQEVPWTSPEAPRRLPRKFPGLSRRSAPFSGKPDTSPDSQRLCLSKNMSVSRTQHAEEHQYG